MILSTIQDALRYKGLSPRLDRALDWLVSHDLNALGTEKMPIEGEEIYVTRFDYKTLPHEETFFEAHEKYLDIHVMVKGRERIDIAHPKDMELFEHSGDFFGYRGREAQTVILEPGWLLIVFPEDAHRVKMAVEEPEEVSRAVFKVLL